MANTLSVEEIEQAIADGRPISVRADQVIWSYVKSNKGWVRVRTELSSPEAAERRLVACADEGDLIFDATANGNATAVLKWFDKVLHARVSDLNMGFIFCGEGSKEEPALSVCVHILQGALPSFYQAPVPREGEYGQAFCAACVALRKKGTLVDFRIVCCPCFVRTQNSVVVPESVIVVANDGPH